LINLKNNQISCSGQTGITAKLMHFEIRRPIMNSKKNINGNKTISRNKTVDHNVSAKSKSRQREPVSQDNKIGDRTSVAAIERVRSTELESNIHLKANNVSDSNRGGESDYVYSSSSDARKKQEQTIKKPQHV
jgi:hypothetical protein